MTSSSILRLVIPPAPWTGALEDGSVVGPGAGFDIDSGIADAPSRFVATHDANVAVGENGVRRVALDVIAGLPAFGIPVFFGREHMQRNWL